MADIFQEVDDEVRQDKLNQAWKKYAPLLIGLAVAVVLATAAFTGWRQYIASERLKASDALIAATTQSATDRPGAIKALDALAADAREPYATLAKLRAAALRGESGDRKGAAAGYADVARTAEDKDLRELADVLSAVQEASGAAPDAAIARLKPLADSGSPWRNVAREYLAYVTFKQGNVAGARTIWEQIRLDPDASEPLKARAAELLSATGGEPAKAPPVTPPAAPAVTPGAPPATPTPPKGTN